MKGNEEYKHIIEHLKKVKEQTGISFKEISDHTMENGEYVSESTIKKVFSPTDPHTHNYEKTIKPIAKLLIGDIDEDTYPRAASYAAINKYKEEVIRQLRLQVSQYKEQLTILTQQKEASSRKHHEHEAILLAQLDFYKEQLKIKDGEIKRLSTNIDRKDATIRQLLIKDRD